MVAPPSEVHATHMMLPSLLGKRKSEEYQQFSAIVPTIRVNLPLQNTFSDGTDRGLNLSA
jgi:ABC-type enterochelin transport system substrate-binding protein